jgi:hypothetical protein
MRVAQVRVKSDLQQLRSTNTKQVLSILCSQHSNNSFVIGFSGQR